MKDFNWFNIRNILFWKKLSIKSSSNSKIDDSHFLGLITVNAHQLIETLRHSYNYMN